MVIDTITDARLMGPLGIAVNPNGLTAYVANFGPALVNGGNAVAVIDTTTDTVTSTISLAPASGPFDIAFTPDGSRAYVTDLSSNSVSVIDTTTNMVLNTIGSIPTPAGIAITPNGRFAYVENFV